MTPVIEEMMRAAARDLESIWVNRLRRRDAMSDSLV